MGKLVVTGTARGEHAYDLLDVNVKFFGRGGTSAKALENLLEQCERFLTIITKMGVEKENIRMKEDEVTEYHSYRDDCDDEFQAERTIVVRIPYEMDLVNVFLEIIAKEDLSAELLQNPIISDEESICKSLTQKALQDAKQKAELYTEGLGQKIVGIDSVKTGNIHKYFEGRLPVVSDHSIDNCISLDISHCNELQSPIKELSEEVEIEFIIE